MNALEKPQIDPAQVLAKAFLNASKELGLTQTEAGEIIGLHRTAVSQLKSKPNLKPDSKSGELALMLIRLARSLFALTGGDKAWTHHFMSSHNKVTHGVPKEQIKTVQGLVRVLQFTDAIRGKV